MRVRISGIPYFTEYYTIDGATKGFYFSCDIRRLYRYDFGIVEHKLLLTTIGIT